MSKQVNSIDPRERLHNLDQISAEEMAFSKMESRNEARILFERHQNRPHYALLIGSFLIDFAKEAIKARQPKAKVQPDPDKFGGDR